MRRKRTTASPVAQTPIPIETPERLRAIALAKPGSAFAVDAHDPAFPGGLIAPGADAAGSNGYGAAARLDRRGDGPTRHRRGFGIAMVDVAGDHFLLGL